VDIDQLVAFERIVREGSFSRAAWVLSIAQPTISARMQALEREVGGPLFTRGRQVALTERGVGFLPYARRALAALTDGVEAARLAHGGQRGRLAVGALRSLTGYFLAPALTHFYTRFPDVECLVREGLHGEVVEHLCDGVIELGLICWPCLDPLLADMTPLLHLHEPVVLVAPRAHPLADRMAVTRDDVSAESDPFLLLRWWQATPMDVTRLAAGARSVADVPMDTGRFLLAHGVGVGFFPRMVIAPDLEGGRVVEVPVADLSPLYRDSALVRLTRHATLSPVAAHFLAILRDEAARVGLLSPRAP